MGKTKLSYGEQLVEACNLTPTINDDERVVSYPTCGEALLHFIMAPWKVLLSFVIPPTHWGGGWFSLVMSLAVIAFLSFVIVDLAHVWECTLGHGIVVVVLLSVGFSLPEAFTSARAASQSKQAEPALGHVFGTSAINFCLGIGLPWVYGTFWMYKRKESELPTRDDELAWTLVVFIGLTIIAWVMMLCFRCCGGELGGRKVGNIVSGAALIVLWLAIVALVVLQAYDYINLDLPEELEKLLKGDNGVNSLGDA